MTDPTAAALLAYREGDRIRRADGTGYSDRVPDSDIWQHIVRAAGARQDDFIKFALAVLDVRKQERAQARARSVEP